MLTLYRAFDCGVSGSREPLTTVFFEATSEQGVVDRLVSLLALLWNAAPDLICVGNLDSTREIERDSVQEADAGNRRWFECGSWGFGPTYMHGPTLLLCNAYNRRQLASAAIAAKKHALALAADLDAAGDADEFHLHQYRAFGTNPLIDAIEGGG